MAKRFNFDEVIPRKQTASVKWDLMKTMFGKEDLLPMWVADMDFRPPQEVLDSLQDRLQHGIFGYTHVPEKASQAVQQWMKRRHHWNISTEWLVYHIAVVPAISSCIQALTEPGDSVLIQAPVYHPFFDMIKLNGRKLINNPLVFKCNTYEFNFADFEQKLQAGVKLFLFCSPHNPVGRVWTKEELKKIGKLCQQYDVTILSDEIHADLTFPPHKHIPIASFPEWREQVITLVSPSKTFNIAGLQASAMIIPNKRLRTLIGQQMKRQGYFTLNTMGIVALEAAYRYGDDWLDALLGYLYENIQLVKTFIEQHLPALTVIPPEGTYLVWIDCRKLGLSPKELHRILVQKGHLALEPGEKFGPGGEGFVRMNVATPRSQLLEGLERLKKALGQIEKGD
ncbi:MAG: putative C-S lyase [Bacillus sp. (in: Bacteria)]|nr:putative C-S lyase [Bacillus sp. (in: firmicutes)]